MNFSCSRVRDPIDVDLTHYSACFPTLNLIKDLTQRDRANQRHRHFTQPLREVVALALLPVVVAVHDFDLMKLCGAYFAPPSRWRLPPYFHRAGSAAVLVAFKTRRQLCLQMERLGSRLIQSDAFHGFLDLAD